MMAFIQQHAFTLATIALLVVVVLVAWLRPKAPTRRGEAIAAGAGVIAVLLALTWRFVYL